MEAEKKPRIVKIKIKNEAKASKKFSLYDAFIGLVILLAIILLVNVVLTFNLSKNLKKSQQATMEINKPAKVELAVIKDSKCNDCFDIAAAVNYVKSAKVNITNEKTYEFSSSEGKQLASKYGIEKIPGLIITGEIEKVQLQGLVKNNGALVLAAPEPPYTNTATGKIEGRVVAYYLKDLSCTTCSDFPQLLVSEMKKSKIAFSDEKTVASDSAQGKDFIKNYHIDFLPAMILSKDASVYEIMSQAWSRYGPQETDGNYVLRLAVPPFINLTTGKLRGLVALTYLTDKSCSECYDVNQHKQILQGSASMKFEKEEKVDISDAKGKELIAKYNITQVPTVIVTGDFEAYPAAQGLKQFFSVEKDGSFIFRKLSALGTYKDLSKNQVVKAAPQQQASQ